MPHLFHPRTAPELTPYYYPVIERAMVEPSSHAFTIQMASLQAGAAWPEMILFTAESAIPVADSVRGYCDAADYEIPLLGVIRANSDFALDFSIGTRAAHTTFQYEVERLRALAAGRVSACVIDQYVITGHTLDLAGMLLHQAGVPHIAGIRGKWYEDAGNKAAIDPIELTSSHGNFLYDVGVKACQQMLG